MGNYKWVILLCAAKLPPRIWWYCPRKENKQINICPKQNK
jgi:hypothetical protein